MQALWLCILLNLIADHHAFVFLGVYVIEANDVLIYVEVAKIIGTSLTERCRCVISYIRAEPLSCSGVLSTN